MTTQTCEAAARITTAYLQGVPCAPVRDLIGSTDVDAAYATQLLVNRARTRAGAGVVGRKIGLTSEAVQAQLGVDQPDFGVLFDDMAYADGAVVPMSRLLQPKVEAELAFVLAADLDGDLSLATVRAAVAYAVVALEIVDSRIAGWDISYADTVADNASSGLFVLGSTRLDLADFDPRETTMSMTLDGDVVSTGSGAACLGDPLNAVLWLARTAQEYGEPLRAGQVILSGALGPMAPVPPGAQVEASLTTTDGRPLGSVEVAFDDGHNTGGQP